MEVFVGAAYPISLNAAVTVEITRVSVSKYLKRLMIFLTFMVELILLVESVKLSI